MEIKNFFAKSKIRKSPTAKSQKPESGSWYDFLGEDSEGGGLKKNVLGGKSKKNKKHLTKRKKHSKKSFKKRKTKKTKKEEPEKKALVLL